jgi:hypothetical protein
LCSSHRGEDIAFQIEPVAPLTKERRAARWAALGRAKVWATNPVESLTAAFGESALRLLVSMLFAAGRSMGHSGYPRRVRDNGRGPCYRFVDQARLLT